MKQNKILIAIGCLSFFLTTAVCQSAPVDIPTSLSQEHLADLIKPAVVRIVDKISGEATIPAFDVDLDTLQPVFLPNATSSTQSMDTFISGSGFVVNSDGYIVTNSHVVSLETIKDQVLFKAWMEALYYKILLLGEAEAVKLEKKYKDKFSNLEESESRQIGEQLLKALREKSVFKLSSKLVVLNPNSGDQTLEKLVNSGFPASIIWLNPESSKDQRDVALIKINQSNLPSVALGSSQDLTSGQKIFVVSYPSTATFNNKDFLQASFTQGVISSVKNSDKGDFKISQTDAKISSGSSGSPLLNGKGEVVGIITFETASDLSSEGDNFAFALPVELVRDILEKQSIANTTINFNQPLLEGLAFMAQRQCQKAIERFQTTSKANSNFMVLGQINKYIENCKQTIANGDSLDNSWDYFKDWLGQVKIWIWYAAVGGFLLVMLLLFVIFSQSRSLKREQLEIDKLGAEASKDRAAAVLAAQKPGLSAQAHTPNTPVTLDPMPEIPISPELREYIKNARLLNMKTPAIAKELRQAGWPEDQINHALK